jgi:hypothetical protein
MNGDQIRQRSAVLRDHVSEWRRGTCGHVGGYRDKLVFGLRRRNARSFRRHKSETEIASEQTIGLTSPRDALDPELALLAKVKRTARYSEGERVLEHFRRSSDFFRDNRRVCLKGLMG